MLCEVKVECSAKKWITIIGATYENVKCYTLRKDNISVGFELQSVVHQSCTLSLKFFLVIDDAPHAAMSLERGGFQWTITSFLKHLTG